MLSPGLPDSPAGRQRRLALTLTEGSARLHERVLARRSVNRLPEVEPRALVIDAGGEQPKRLALGLVRAAAGRPDPFDRGGDVVDAVGQLYLRLRALRRPDAQRRPGLVGAPRAAVTGGEWHLQHGLVELAGAGRVPRHHRHVRDVALAQPGGP